MIVNTVLLATGWWRLVLGDAGGLPNAALAAFVCVTVYCLGVPVSIPGRASGRTWCSTPMARSPKSSPSE